MLKKYYMLKISKVEYLKKTKRALISSAILNAPLFCMYSLTTFILRKDLKASVFHLALLTMLRPTMAFISYFWSSYIFNREDKLKANFLWASFLSCFLFLLFPFVSGIWFVIITSAIYMLFHRAKAPAWMEIVKLNIEEVKREKLYAFSSSIAYFIGPVLAFIFPPILEKNPLMYKNLFFIAGIFGLINVFILSKIPINFMNRDSTNRDSMNIDSTNSNLTNRDKKIQFLKPIKEGFHLLKTRPDFYTFQLGYMLAGFGLMLIQPIIAIFCVDKLNISYYEFIFAILIFKDMGFVVSSPIWGRLFTKFSILKLSAFMFGFFALFMITITFATYNILWLYIAFLIYGIASSGSHLLWNLSGPTFAKNENSAKYTSINVVMTAIRGSIAPALGSFLVLFIPEVSIFLIGAVLCISSFYMLLKKRNVFVQINKNN